MNAIQTFSTQTPDEKSLDPAEQLLRLTAKWRRERNLDDSTNNQRMSVQAVFAARPKLAKEYQMRQVTLAKARGNNPWTAGDLED